MLKTLGGDRLGSGNKMKVAMHNYERSTHNLGNVFRTTAAPGVLIPFYKKLALNGDTWTIKLSSLARTMPAIGPLFGSYKLQMDIFECPIRLYNGILHNNMTKIGMDMSKVKLPKIKLQGQALHQNLYEWDNYDTYQISSSALLAYLGIRGIGANAETGGAANISINRTFNAVPILAYYDIFKNYYANKQEKNAYVIKPDLVEKTTQVQTLNYTKKTGADGIIKGITSNLSTSILDETTSSTIGNITTWDAITNGAGDGYRNQYQLVEGIDTLYQTFTFNYNGRFPKGTGVTFIKLNFYKTIQVADTQTGLSYDAYEKTRDAYYDITDPSIFTALQYERGKLTFSLANGGDLSAIMQPSETLITIGGIGYTYTVSYESKTKLQEFALDNIDTMRINILKNTALNTQFELKAGNTDTDYYPYKALTEFNANIGKMTGLVLKTYQSDMFNNWLSTEWIDGINGINAITAVSTASGSFTIDALNLAHKVYNMLNRIAVSGGTYEDWQEAVYGEDAIRRAESPIYCGGMSGVITFEEVVSTADTQTEAAGDQPLGSLAGKGILTNVEGGNIEIHVKEPSYIIGIMSITPYLDYCQGNDFDMTELDSLNDLHKPALDQIGFQNLMTERAAWWSTWWDSANSKWVHSGGGKLPAWIEYMTSVNQVYGDFADGELKFMTLTRDYKQGDALYNGTNQMTKIKDWTTYINPSQFNYQFANTDLDAQNFWIQIGINAIARRKMSAKVIPNL